MFAWWRRWWTPLRPIEPPEAPPLPGLAGEAALLLAAYEGFGHQVPIIAPRAAIAREIVATEAALDAAEEGRWMQDAGRWAHAALAATRDDADPYRADARVDPRLREAGRRVRRAIDDDSMTEVAAALGEYVAWARGQP